MAPVPSSASHPPAISSQLRAILPAAAAGTLLRLWNLRPQVLVGDEIHAIRAALGDDLATVLTTYRDADPCLPLAGLYRLLIDLGIPLSELVLRLPVLITGIVALVALPLLLGRLAPRAQTAFAWLLALSPTLILYSRIARPYAPIVLWCGLAAGCFWNFWSSWRVAAARGHALEHSRAAIAGFLVCATLAVWFHLGAAPFVAALFCYALLDLALERPPAWRRLLRNLIVIGLALAAVMALPLLPAAASLEQLAAGKRVAQDVPVTTYAAVARLLAGTNVLLVATLFWAAALFGLVRLLRRSPRAALFSLTLVVGQTVGIRLLSPIALEHPIAFHRYLLPALPFVLLWVAVAISPPWPGAERFAKLFSERGWHRTSVGLQTLCLAGLALAGPFTNSTTWHTSFLHDAPYVDFSQPPPRPDTRVLAQNRQLAQRPGDRAIIAAIWPPNRYGSRIFELGQQVHGRRVIVVSPGLAGHSAVSFRNFVAPDPHALLASDAQFLVLHNVVLPTAAAARDVTTSAWPRELRRRFGESTWRDGEVQVWDLDAIRARLPRAEPSGEEPR